MKTILDLAKRFDKRHPGYHANVVSRSGGMYVIEISKMRGSAVLTFYFTSCKEFAAFTKEFGEVGHY